MIKRAQKSVQKPVGAARPVGALKPVGAGGMAKMPTTGSTARRPDMGRVQKPVGGGFKPNMPMVPDMSRVQKPVGAARPVGALKPVGAGGMAKMPTTGSTARRPDMGRVQKPMLKKGGAVKKAAAKKRMA